MEVGWWVAHVIIETSDSGLSTGSWDLGFALGFGLGLVQTKSLSNQMNKD